MSCANCHENVGDHFRAQSSGDANGPVPSVKKLTANQLNTTCLKCHEKAGQANYLSSMHARRNVACTECHGIHEYKSIRGQLKTRLDPETCFTCHKPERAKSMQTSHHPVREGKMSCASCHNPHDGAQPKMLKADSVNELCYTCHAEKRGPFLFEHAPVREDCVSCHEPHGTNHKRLLVAEAAEPVLELPSHRLRPLRVGRQPLDRAGRAHRPDRRADRLPDGELAVRREELQELPHEPARLQLALGRVLREVTHEESIERHSAPRHGPPHGDSSRDGAAGGTGCAGHCVTTSTGTSGGQLTVGVLGASRRRLVEVHGIPGRSEGRLDPLLQPVLDQTASSTSTCSATTSGRRPALHRLVQDLGLRPVVRLQPDPAQHGQRRAHDPDRARPGRLGHERHAAAGRWAPPSTRRRPPAGP